jgi:hypothetical protein
MPRFPAWPFSPSCLSLLAVPLPPPNPTPSPCPLSSFLSQLLWDPAQPVTLPRVFSLSHLALPPPPPFKEAETKQTDKQANKQYNSTHPSILFRYCLIVLLSFSSKSPKSCPAYCVHFFFVCFETEFCSEVQAGFESLILLLLPLEYWDYRSLPPYPARVHF